MKKTAAESVRRRLLAHYDGGKRDLPWRSCSDPYRIWVSEVMLQQTRVETVLPYYERWVEQFPTLEDLAGAEEEEVLKAWEGLGYYSRARRLHGAAKVVRERYAGELPASAEELKALPGVGEYTAGAVASIAFGERVGVVDGNVRRVFSRLFDLPDPSPSELRSIAAELVDPDRPGDFNQALMELGATICTPRSPSCSACPFGDRCRALAEGTVEERPRKKAKKAVPEVDVGTLVAVWLPEGSVFRHPVEGSPKLGPSQPAAPDPGPHFLLRKRPNEGLLAGLWEFPGVEGGRALELAAEWKLTSVRDPAPLPTVTHVFSHLKARYHPLLVEAAEKAEVDGVGWVSVQELEELPLPVAQRKIARAAVDALARKSGEPT